MSDDQETHDTSVAEPLRYRGASQRRAAIATLLHSTGFLTISEIVKRFGVSEMTARRDVRQIVDDGDALAARGGLRLPIQSALAPTAYSGRLVTDMAAKSAIGVAAASQLQRDEVIAIDAGTTALQLAAALPADFEGTVITHSVPVINLLLERPSVKALVLGGDLYRPSQALVGYSVLSTVQTLRARTFYMGAAAADERGIYGAADAERNVKHALMGVADRVVLLIDHHKFDASAPVMLCRWDRLAAVVSDQPLPRAIATQLAEHDIEQILPAQPARI